MPYRTIQKIGIVGIQASLFGYGDGIDEISLDIPNWDTVKNFEFFLGFIERQTAPFKHG